MKFSLLFAPVLLLSGALLVTGPGCWYGDRPRYERPGRGRQYRQAAQQGQRPYRGFRGGAWTGAAGDARKLQGTVTGVHYVRGASSGREMVVILLSSGGRESTVRLGPAAFLQTDAMLPRVGDPVSVQGFNRTCRQGDFLIATELQKDGKTFVLRDDDGRPVW